MNPNPNATICPEQFAGLQYLSTSDDIRYYWRSGQDPECIAATLEDLVVARIAFSGNELRLDSIDIHEDYRHLGIVEELLSHVEGIYGRDWVASDLDCINGYCG